MSRKRIAALLSGLTMNMLFTVAMAANTDGVQGHILSTKNNRPLAGVSVLVRETGRSTTTAADGSFSFKDLPPGTYTLVIMAGNGSPVMRTVRVSAGSITQEDIRLNPYNARSPSVASLGQVTVRSARRQVAVARAKQEVAPNIINVLSAADIRKLPDVNAGEAARRLPGVSMTTDTGEGRYINIRGLDADLTSTTFGGVRLPPTNVAASPNGGGRAVAFDAIPAGMIGSITVTKTNTPEQDAEALGGTIEITPKQLPPSGKPFLNFKVGTGVEELRSSPITDLSISGGTRFGFDRYAPKDGYTTYSEKPFSFVGSLDYYEDKRGVDDLEAGYAVDGGTTSNPKAFSAIEQRYYNYHRKRHGIGGELAYEPDANDRWYARAFDTGYMETVNRNRLVVNFPGSPTQNADGSFTESGVNFDKTLRDEKERIDSQVYTIGGENKLGKTKVDYHLAFVKGVDDKPYDYNSDFNNPGPATVTYNNVADPNYPSWRVINGPNPAAPNGYTLQSIRNSSSFDETKEWSGATNIATPTHFTSAQDEELKVGVSARLRKNSHDATPFNYDGPTGQPFTNALADGPITFYNGHYQNGYNIDPGYIRNLWATGPTSEDTQSAILNHTDNKENVYAVYGQEHMTFGKLGLLGGVRVENTQATYNGNAAVSDQNGNTTIQPVSNSNHYTNAFPTLQGRYEFTPSLIGRASFSSTIARPGFNQTTAASNVDLANNIVAQGNPNLKPILANNIDLSLEDYLPHAGILSFGVFNKDLKDYIVSRVNTQTFPNSGIYAGLAPNTRVYTYDNISHAYARGFDFNFEKRFTNLPGLWSGLGAGANWTYVDAKGEIRPGEEHMLPSTSRNTYNTSLFYERGRWNLRLAGYYVGRSLWSVGGSPDTDIYTEPKFSADFGASYALDKHLGLYFNIKNLTNTPLKFTEGTPDRPIQREFYEKTYQVGLTGSF